MPMIVTQSQLQLGDTARNRKRRADAITSLGAENAEHELTKQRAARKQSGWHENVVNPGDEVNGVPRAAPHPRKQATKHRAKLRTIPHATIAIQYSQRSAYLFAHRSVTVVYNAWKHGHGFARMNARAILIQAAMIERG